MSDPVSTSSEVQRALVFGAGGGVGGALVSQLAARNYEVVALARRPIANLAGLQVTVDIEDEASIANAAAILATGAPITRVFVATGLLHAPGIQPERSNAELDPDQLMRLFAVNAVGPALVAKHFLPLLPKSGRAVFAILSARVGSIGDNRLGGWHSYRASKAALNMLIRTLSIELTRTRRDAILVGLHPGTVDTGLSKPFQSRVPELFTPIQSADYLLAVTDGLQARDSGGVFAWDGRRIAE
jgi:NAD(P)-dependent dehydrogenase (short-subunit alcohol dehydrogenase family)